MTERDHLATAREVLREAGYYPVQEEAIAGKGPLSIKGKGPLSVRADLVGWAPIHNELRQAVLVEIKQGPVHAERMVRQIRNLANAFGTTDHYMYNGEWHHIDLESGHVQHVSGPVVAAQTTSETTLGREAAEALVDEQAARSLRNALAHHHDSPEALVRTVRVVVDTIEATGVTLRDTTPAWAVLRKLTRISELFGREYSEWFGMPEELARAMVRLADLEEGDTLVDPVCGVGTILWAAQDLASKRGMTLKLRGTDINRDTIEVADAFGDLSPMPLDLIKADLLYGEYPIADETADRVVGVPPMGLKLRQPVQITNGQQVRRDGDIAIIDRMLQIARPGGRIVVQTTRGFLSRSGPTRQYRDYLANEMHVRAIVGLPGGLVPSTSIPTALLVIDKSAPADEALVADLASDWPDQLADDGDFMAEFKKRTG